MKSESGFLNLSAGRLEYQRFHSSKSDRLTLVLLHEGLGCVDLWKEFPAQLSTKTDCDVIAYSRFGYGRSDPIAVPRPLTYMHDEALKHLGPILDDLAVKRCVLIGHSDGASIAAIYAGGVKDDRVNALVLMAPHFFNEEVCVASIQKAKTTYEHEGLRERLKFYHGENVDCAFWGWNSAWLDPDFMQWNIEEYLPSIRVPTLAIQGEEDEYGSIEQIECLQKKSGGPVNTLMLQDCKHSPFRDQTDKTINAIVNFLK